MTSTEQPNQPPGMQPDGKLNLDHFYIAKLLEDFQRTHTAKTEEAEKLHEAWKEAQGVANFAWQQVQQLTPRLQEFEANLADKVEGKADTPTPPDHGEGTDVAESGIQTPYDSGSTSPSDPGHGETTPTA